MQKWAFALGAVVLAVSAPVAAWNGRGHMIVAAKAWEHMKPQTRVAVGRLLRHNPAFADWTRGVSASDRDRVAFIQAATWADDIKSDNVRGPMRRFTNGYTSDGVTGPNARRNSGYDDCQRHGFWHYKDLPFWADRPSVARPDPSPDRQPPDPNIETQINALGAVLRDASAGDELKAYDLVWLIHLVGDIHQPLHATGRFVADDPNGDEGGNDVFICLTASCGTGSPLHSFWDGAFGGSENVASVTIVAGGLPDPDPGKAAILTPRTWLNESFALATTHAYAAPIDVDLDRAPFLLTAAYRSNTFNIARDQVALAGVRLANLLDGASLTVRGDPVQPRQCRRGRPV